MAEAVEATVPEITALRWDSRWMTYTTATSKGPVQSQTKIKVLQYQDDSGDGVWHDVPTVDNTDDPTKDWRPAQ